MQAKLSFRFWQYFFKQFAVIVILDTEQSIFEDRGVISTLRMNNSNFK